VAAHEQRDFRQISRDQPLIAGFKGSIEVRCFLPFYVNRIGVSRPIPKVPPVAIEISGFLSGALVKIVAPWSPSDMVSPRVSTEIELKTTVPLIRIVEKQDIIQITNRSDALVLKEPEKGGILDGDAGIC